MKNLKGNLKGDNSRKVIQDGRRATKDVTLPHSQTGWTTLYGKCEQGGKLRNEV